MALVAALTLYSCWASAVCLVALWSWFIVPTFGLAALTLPQAFGLSLIVGYMTYNHYSHYDKDEREWPAKFGEIAVLMLRPWFVLLMGYICKAWFM